VIIDRCRDVEELKRLYDSRPMPFQYEFEFLINNPNLFCFYDEQEGFLRGFITVQYEYDEGERVLTLSGTSIKKNFKDNVDAIEMVCSLFDEDIYSFTPLREAGLVLRKARFERVDNKGKYIRRRKLNGFKISSKICKHNF
jgi:hypothetical protein